MNEIIEKIKNYKNIRYEIKDEILMIYNIDNNNSIEIIEETYSSKNDSYREYIVSFSTQHCHFDDDIEEVIDYINKIMDDQTSQIEFYLNDEKRFGGDISREQFNNLSIKFLMDYFGYKEEYIKNYDYEIHSWSGKYDRKRQPITNIKK